MPTVGLISLGCPKALVDSERILTELTQAPIELVDGPGDVTVINTCGFIDQARAESFATIEAALHEGGEVVVTGCLGKEATELQARFPELRFVSGPADTRAVVDAVTAITDELDHGTSEPPPTYHVGPEGVKLTPPHYAYLKISEGCNHKCSFCIIPQLRGKLVSRPISEVLVEAEHLVASGVQELLVVAQDTSAYGVDLKYAEATLGTRRLRSELVTLARELGAIAPWVRLHYVYPYPHVDNLLPLMAEGLVLPYLDMPLQHASVRVLKDMRRPAAVEKVLHRLDNWRQQCPEIVVRSTFIVGFPGETDAEFDELLGFLEAAQLDRVGCFTYSAVEGAHANALPEHVPERDKLDRQEALMEVQATISAEKLKSLVGQDVEVLVDQVTRDVESGQLTAVARSYRDAPEIDGQVHIADAQGLKPGEFAWVRIDSAQDHDLSAHVLGQRLELL